MQGPWETITEKRILLTQATEQIAEFWEWMYMFIKKQIFVSLFYN